MSFEARWVIESDWPAIARWLESEPSLIEAFGLVQHPFVIVATQEGIPVAAISLMWGPWGYGLIDWLIRDPENPSARGAGRYICKVAIATLQGLGMQGLTAVVRKDRERVLRHHLSLPGMTRIPGEYAMINLVFKEEQFDGERH